jgi:hypothetical protein
MLDSIISIETLLVLLLIQVGYLISKIKEIIGLIAEGGLAHIDKTNTIINELGNIRLYLEDALTKEQPEKSLGTDRLMELKEKYKNGE